MLISSKLFCASLCMYKCKFKCSLLAVYDKSTYVYLQSFYEYMLRNFHDKRLNNTLN